MAQPAELPLSVLKPVPSTFSLAVGEYVPCGHSLNTEVSLRTMPQPLRHDCTCARLLYRHEHVRVCKPCVMLLTCAHAVGIGRMKQICIGKLVR